MTQVPPLTVLVVGATGSVGRHVVAQSLGHGYRTRALVRDAARASLPDGTELVVGDLTRASTLGEAVDGVDGVVFTHGASYGSSAAEAVDYGAVRNVLEALGGHPARVALMTSIGVTKRGTTHDWKRRGERLVRASGRPYTIVRPGWFDYNDPGQLHLQFLQGDLRLAGTPADGVIARDQIAQVLLASLTSPAADRKTLELVADSGNAQSDLEPLFAALKIDTAGGLDGALDRDNMPHRSEPSQVVLELADIKRAASR